MWFDNKKKLVAILTLSISLGCSSAKKNADQAAPAPDGNAEFSNILAAINTRLDGLETKMSTLNDKLDSNKKSMTAVYGEQNLKTVGVMPHPSERSGAQAEGGRASGTDGGYSADGAVKSFREAMILLQAQKYPEATLAFSSFLERFADHPLAGTAQFYIGESYFKQKEYKLALQEYQRVLTSYDRSPNVAEALRQMAEAEDQLKMPEEAAKHRQTLASLFPQSPAAAGLASLNPEGTIKPQKSDLLEKAVQTKKRRMPKKDIIDIKEPAEGDTEETKDKHDTLVNRVTTDVLSRHAVSAPQTSDLDEPPATAAQPDPDTEIKPAEAH